MPTSPDDVAHLLRRTGFGGKPAEIAELAKLDLPQVVDRILNAKPSPLNAPPIVTNPSAKKYEAWIVATQWWVDRMATTPAPLIEKMVLFWHGHFVSSLDKVDMPPMWEQLQLFRTKGMGNFTELCQAMAIGPAMLDYLDNRKNTAGRANENFARELMELFTLGVGNYTQEDVVASARAWTGHGVDATGRRYVFDAKKHDNGNKTFFGVTKNWNGPDIINEICNGKSRPIVAGRIVYKLWRFFAHQTPAPHLQQALTAVFIQSNLDIKTLLRAMFLRPEFYNKWSEASHVYSPIEYVAAVTKYTGIKAADSDPQSVFEPIGQRPFYPPNVGGWTSYKGWVTTSAMWGKGNFARRVAIKAAQKNLLGDTSKLTPAAAADKALATFGINRATDATREALASTVQAERQAKGRQEEVHLIALALLAPEFQLG